MEADKKKTIVVGALVVAMLGIGAFQFGKMGEAEAPPATAKSEEAKAEGEAKPEDKEAKTKNPMYAASLAGRDPFRPAAFATPTKETAKPVNPAPVAAPPIEAPKNATPLPNAMGGALNPMPLPNGGPDGGGLPNPQAPEPEKPRFTAKLIGVLVGARSAAVFRVGDAERIVTVGAELEPGARLISVSARRAVVRFRGETLTIDLRDEAPPEPAASKAETKPSLPPAPQTGGPTLPEKPE